MLQPYHLIVASTCGVSAQSLITTQLPYSHMGVWLGTGLDICISACMSVCECVHLWVKYQTNYDSIQLHQSTQVCFSFARKNEQKKYN